MFTMPAVTLVAFILGYLDVASRFVSLASGGGWIGLKIAYLGIVIAANSRLKWARVVWSLWMIVGMLVSVWLAGKVGEGVLLIVFCGIILPTVLMILLWHPTTTEWYERERSS